LNPVSDQASPELASLASGSVVVAYCNPEVRRAAYINTLCSNSDPSFKLIGEVPNSYDGERWILVEKS